MSFSLSLSWTVSCSILSVAPVLLLLHYTLKWPILPHSLQVFAYARHCLSGWLLPQYLHVCFVGVFVCICLLGVSLCVFFIIFSLLNSFASMRLFMMVDWALCTLTLFAHDNIFSLVIFHFHLSLQAPRLFLPTYQCNLNHG